MKIKRFYEQETFIPLSRGNDGPEDRIYYKLHIDNSFKKFEIILDKLGIKKMVYMEFGHDVDNYRKYVENNAVIYLLIDFFKSDVKNDDFQIEIVTDENDINSNDDLFQGRLYGGEVFA